MTIDYKRIPPENIDKLAVCTGCGSVVYNTEENRSSTPLGMNTLIALAVPDREMLLM